jgi:hypothetical protein
MAYDWIYRTELRKVSGDNEGYLCVVDCLVGNFVKFA